MDNSSLRLSEVLKHLLDFKKQILVSITYYHTSHISCHFAQSAGQTVRFLISWILQKATDLIYSDSAGHRLICRQVYFLMCHLKPSGCEMLHFVIHIILQDHFPFFKFYHDSQKRLVIVLIFLQPECHFYFSTENISRSCPL